MNKDEKSKLDEITKFLRKLLKRAPEGGASANAVRFLEILLCRLYNAKSDTERIRTSLSEAKDVIISEIALSPEEEEYVELFDEVMDAD